MWPKSIALPPRRALSPLWRAFFIFLGMQRNETAFRGIWKIRDLQAAWKDGEPDGPWSRLWCQDLAEAGGGQKKLRTQAVGSRHGALTPCRAKCCRTGAHRLGADSGAHQAAGSCPELPSPELERGLSSPCRGNQVVTREDFVALVDNMEEACLLLLRLRTQEHRFALDCELVASHSSLELLKRTFEMGLDVPYFTSSTRNA